MPWRFQGLSGLCRVRAHHSFALYEPELQIKFSGSVTEFKWANPHVYIRMDAVDKATGKRGIGSLNARTREF